MGEYFPAGDPEAQQLEVPEHELMLRFGVSAEEAAQEVEFNGHVGTLGQMLTDEGCPVGSMVEQAHQEGGVEAVREKLQGINSLFGSNIPTEIAPKTQDDYENAVAESRSHEQVKKN